MNEKTKLLAAEITQFLDEHKAQHPVMIDVSEHAGWTDCFIIGTVNSLGHLKGLPVLCGLSLPIKELKS